MVLLLQCGTLAIRITAHKFLNKEFSYVKCKYVVKNALIYTIGVSLLCCQRGGTLAKSTKESRKAKQSMKRNYVNTLLAKGLIFHTNTVTFSSVNE